MALPELTSPEGFELAQAVLTTFDLDLAVLKGVPGFADNPGKFTVFRGEGEFVDVPASDPDRESLLASVVTVAFPKGADGRPKGYAHGKIALFDYVCAHEHRYRLCITSANISSYDNLETSTVFSGQQTGEKQTDTLPLIDYLSVLNAYADGRLDGMLERLREVRFEPLPDYACEDHSFAPIIPGTASGADLLSGPFDELLVISPFIDCQECLSLVAAAKQNARVVILSQTPVIRRLIQDGLIEETSKLPIRLHLLPHGKTQTYIHAKIYLRRTGKRWNLFTGSMNLTPFALTRNLEFMVRRINPQGIGSLEDYLASFFSGFVSETAVRRRLSPDDDCCEKTDSAFCRRAASEELRLDYLSGILTSGRYSEKQSDLITEYLLSPQSSADLISLFHGNGPTTLPIRYRRVTKGKSREIYEFPLKERMLQGLINRALHEVDGCFSKRLYSHIQGRVMRSILIAIRQCPDFGDLYVFKTDIKDYDASMDADVLSKALRHIPELDPSCLTFLETFIRQQACLENGALLSDAQAVPTGSPLCGFFENVYLREMDFLLAEKAAFYARYADDILIAAFTQEELDGLIHILTQELENKKLSINEGKSLRLDPGSSFSFLNWYVTGNQVDFLPDMLAELKRSIHSETKRLLVASRKNRLPEEMRLFLAISRANHLIDHWGLEDAFRAVSVHDGLKQIDHMLYDMIRTVATGKMGNGRYRIRNKQIREWGYQSLVNRYYRYIAAEK